MPKLNSLKPKQVIQALLRFGFYIYHQSGSHIQLRHRIKFHLRITVPYHKQFDIPIAVVNSIIKQCELSRDEFLKIL
ncbi:MAG: type II toxin-antitoxin system HicA family toxin [Patescibacteria group bacterium]